MPSNDTLNYYHRTGSLTNDDCGSLTTTSNAGDYYTYATGDMLMYRACDVPVAPDCYGRIQVSEYPRLNDIKKENDNMKLWEVILVNPKDDTYEIDCIVARTSISALMKAYELAQMEVSEIKDVEFDDLKTKCTVLMEWSKEEK